MTEVQKARMAVLKALITQKGGNIEFAESVTIVGQYGDRAGTKYLFIQDGVLRAHVYNVWMENMSADIEHTPLSDETYIMLTNKIRNYGTSD